MHKSAHLLLSAMIVLAGCRFVLDDNPPESEPEKDKASKVNHDSAGPEAQSAEPIDVAYLDKEDPRLYLANDPGAERLIISGTRDSDGNARTINHIQFDGSHGSRALTVLSPNELEYESETGVTVTLSLASESNGMSALVQDAGQSTVQAFLIESDETMIQAASESIRRQATQPGSWPSYAADTSGYFVAEPKACDKALVSASGTSLSLTLNQGLATRSYPLFRAESGQWRTSAPMPGQQSKATADAHVYASGLSERIRGVCNWSLPTASGPYKEDISLVSATRKLARISPLASAHLEYFETDIRRLCSIDEARIQQSSLQTEAVFDATLPIDATLTLTQGMVPIEVSKSWTNEAGDSFQPMTIEAPEFPAILSVDYTDQPLYVGDQYSLSVNSQCSQEYSLVVEVYDAEGNKTAVKDEYIRQEITQPNVTRFEPLFDVKKESRYEVELTLRTSNGDIVDSQTIKPTLR